MNLHLIGYRDTGGEQVLHLCEDATGLPVGPTDHRLTKGLTAYPRRPACQHTEQTGGRRPVPEPVPPITHPG